MVILEKNGTWRSETASNWPEKWNFAETAFAPRPMKPAADRAGGSLARIRKWRSPDHAREWSDNEN
jgi:hypothetical protein